MNSSNEIPLESSHNQTPPSLAPSHEKIPETEGYAQGRKVEVGVQKFSKIEETSEKASSIGETTLLEKGKEKEFSTRSKEEINRIRRPTLSQVKQGKDAIHLQQIATGVARAAGITPLIKKIPRNIPHIHLPVIPGSANPVTKLEPQFYIKKSDIKAAQQSLKVDFDSAKLKRLFQEAIQDASAEIFKNPEIKDKSVSNEVLKKAADTFSFIPKNQIHFKADDLEEIFDIIAEVRYSASEHQARFLDILVLKLETLDTSINIRGVPTLYSKDEVASYLRVLAAQTKENPAPVDEKALRLQKLGEKFKLERKKIDDLEQYTIASRYQEKVKSATSVPRSAKREEIGKSQESEIIYEALVKLREQPAFFDAAVLDKFGLTPAVIKKLKENITEHVSSYEVAYVNSNKSAQTFNLLKNLLKIETEHYPSYGFKTGAENSHEILAGQLLEPLGLETYVLKKTEQKLDYGELSDKVGPSGIGSRWVEGEDFPKIWNEWLVAKHAYKMAQASGTLTEKMQGDYMQLRQKVLEAGGTRSIGEHFILNTAAMASDAHINQYKRSTEDGEFYTYDFSRFFAPFPAYKNGGSTILTIRNDFLDHPLAEEPLTPSSPYEKDLQNIKDKVLSWDVGKIEKEWRDKGLVGTLEFFKEKGDALLACDKNYALVNRHSISEEVLNKIAQEYGVSPLKKEDKNAFKERIIEAIKDTREQIKQEVWLKAHPKAIEQFKIRTEEMQKYYRNTPEPTLRGAWEAFYPEIAPFSHALEIMEANLGSGLIVHGYLPEEIKNRDYKNQIQEISKARERQIELEKEKESVSDPQALASAKLKFERAVPRLRAFIQASSQGAKPMTKEHLPEMILPQHYYGEKAHGLWEIWSKTPSVADGFVEWVEKLEKGEDVPGKEEAVSKELATPEGNIRTTKVHYLGVAERLQTQLKFEGGQASSNKEGVLNTTDERHIFVMDNSNTFYAAPYKQGVINHSSFFSGRPVQGAGEFIFKEGILTEITDKSGHYQPDDRMILKELRALDEQGVDLSKVRFTFTVMQQSFNALQLKDNLTARENAMKVVRVRSLEELIKTASKHPLISSNHLKEMKKAHMQIKDAAPGLAIARTGSPL